MANYSWQGGIPGAGGGGIASGGAGGGGFGGTDFKSLLGTNFSKMFSGAPNAPIKPPVVKMPSPGDFGTPVSFENVPMPSRSDFGTPSQEGIVEAASEARQALQGFNNPRGTQAFSNLMGLASEVTARQAGEARRRAADAAQRSGYSASRANVTRQSERDRMLALAETGFQGAATIREQQGAVYATAKAAFAELQSAYQQAKAAGDIAYANAVTATHFKNAEMALGAAGLNIQQKLAFGNALNDARKTQAQLDQAYNNSLIDNNRYISAQQQIAAQLLATQMALAQKSWQFQQEMAFKSKSLAEQMREFDLGLKADPNTALRTFSDPRYGGSTGKKQKPLNTANFTGLL